MPIIQPEYHGPEDTLITWVLTYLKEYFEDKDDKGRFEKVRIKQNDDGNEGVKPADFIEKLRESEALFSRKFASNLAAQDVTAIDFQRETLAVVDAQSHFMSGWRNLVNKLIVGDEEKKKISPQREDHPFLIIPIDDADLNPVALPVIMQQIQILQHPNVLFLFSVQMKSLRSMMYISQLELNTNRADTQPVVNFGNLIDHKIRETEDIRVDAMNRIDKYLPRKYRVDIQPLPPKERLEFKPLIKSNKGDYTPTFLAMYTRNLQNDGGFFASDGNRAKFANVTPLEPYVRRTARRTANLAPIQRDVKLYPTTHDFFLHQTIPTNSQNMI